MEGLELISFKIIASVGNARGMFINAIRLAKKGKFKEAESNIKQGDEFMIEGHHAHMEVLTMQSNGEDIPFDLLLVHAEDQMMSAETTKIMAEEMIDLYKVVLSGEK
jgi:PTS system cellobiose-specific IIA component